jgi:hypothetical protein
LSTIGPGSLLLCVDQTITDPLYTGPTLELGRVYECLDIEPGNGEACGCGFSDFINLVEYGDSPEWGFCACEFVPAGKRGDFTSLLKAVKRAVKEDA